MHADNTELNRISEQIIGGTFRVQNALRVGSLEKVYENALAYKLRRVGLKVAQQYDMTVRYDGIVVGEYAADLLVGHAVLAELKAVRRSMTFIAGNA